MLEKQPVLSVNENKHVQPPDLDIEGYFERKGITNPAIYKNGNSYLIYARLIYADSGTLVGHGDNSAIVRYNVHLKADGSIYVDERSEKAVFTPHGPHGYRGMEDLRFATIRGEDALHAFLVHHDGFNSRTEYFRWEGDTQHNFGVWFPNIDINDALEKVRSPQYRIIWEDAHGPSRKKEMLKLGKYIPEIQYLGTKDCSLWPNKINIGGEEYYGVIIRLFPDIQIVFVRDFLELARKEFWHKVVKNIDDLVLLKQEQLWEASHIGLAGQPITIPLDGKYREEFGLDEVTLIFYHGATDSPREYKLGAALADPNNPQRIIARTEKPILEATHLWERERVVQDNNGLIFPTAHFWLPEQYAIEHWGGASDNKIFRAIQSLDEILNAMVRVETPPARRGLEQLVLDYH